MPLTPSSNQISIWAELQNSLNWDPSNKSPNRDTMWAQF